MTPTPDDAMVEGCAKAMHASMMAHSGWNIPAWDTLTNSSQKEWLNVARAAIAFLTPLIAEREREWAAKVAEAEISGRATTDWDESRDETAERIASAIRRGE